MSSNLLPLDEIRVIGLAGAGSVGAGWAALILAAGYEVLYYDPDPGAGMRLHAAVKSAWPVLQALTPGLANEPPLSRIHSVDSLEALARSSDLIQENVAEAPEIKGPVIARLDAELPADRLILSSSGGVPPTQLQGFCRNPERLLLGHPFHPAYVIPLVEVVAGTQTRPDAVDLAVEFYTRIGKRPIRLQREMIGHLANRLQFAILREAVHCLDQGVASAEDIDAAVRWGLGLRWMLLGPLMTFNLAGGAGGIEQLMARFRDDVQGWWDALGSPRLTTEVCEKLFLGVQHLRSGVPNEEWERWRDAELVELLKFRAAHPYLAETLKARLEA